MKAVEVEKTLTKKMLDEVSESHYHESVNLETGMAYHEREMESAKQKKEEAEKKSLIKRQTQMDPLRFLDPDYVDEELSESSEVLETPMSEQSKEYEVFYDPADIKATYVKQKKDMFEELGETRRNIILQNNGMRGLQLQNKINILKHAPEDGASERLEDVFIQ